jgi:glycine/D-amino acid oxidase-like deaminating enzyme
MKPMSFAGPASVQALDEPILVNCLGLGSRKVWPDEALHGRKGQLALLKAQPHLHYLYSGIGYMFPRQDHLVVGGSVEYPSVSGEDDTPDPAMGLQMIKIVQAVFAGALPLPPWLAGAGGVVDQET